MAEGRKILGLGSGLPTLTCKQCGSVAIFDPGTTGNDWRVRYKRVNRADRYYYCMVFLGEGGWLEAEQALVISRRGYIQRVRMAQVEQGDLSWLKPSRLESPPPLMSPEEQVYVTLSPVMLQQMTRGGTLLAQDDGTVLDSGTFYLTDRKIHMLGQRRDWSHKFADIRNIEYTDHYWRVHVGAAHQFYQGMNHPEHMDAQLFCMILKHLMVVRP